jgi:hypothetical protein
VQLAALLALALAGAACRLRARTDRDADLLACARLLEALLAADLLNLLAARALTPLPTPYAGPARALFHCSQFCTLAWPFGVSVLAWRLFAPGRRHLLGGAWWISSGVALALDYPTLRGEALADTYRLTQVACVLFTLVSLLVERPSSFRAGRAHLVSLLLLAGLGAELFGPYLLAAPFASWWTAQATWTLTLTAAALAAAWRRPWTRSPTC